MKITYKTKCQRVDGVDTDYEVSLALGDDGTVLFSRTLKGSTSFSEHHSTIDSFITAANRAREIYRYNDVIRTYWDQIIQHSNYLKIVQSGGVLTVKEGKS